jgi:hypothetical protein
VLDQRWSLPEGEVALIVTIDRPLSAADFASIAAVVGEIERKFLDRLSDKITAEIQAVLEAVAVAPPPSFSGGGKWEAMHDEMAGIYEVRVQSRGANHGLFWLLERNATDLGGPAIILGGLSKPVRSAASARDYRRIRQYADEFRKRRTICGQQDQDRRS